jgi:DNA (cytosine-5)-methyltransferase 1
LSRPLLLDTFCKAGGAGMGYHLAGFDVVGVDIEPQPNYPFPFIQADAIPYIEEHGHEYDAIHASPPCQAYCAMKHLTTKAHPDLVDATRAALIKTGKPYVIENVPGAPLINPIILCGTMFGLETSCGAQLRRHRLFETNWRLRKVDLLAAGLWCRHDKRRCVSITGHTAEGRKGKWTGHTISVTGSGQPVGRTIMVVGETPRDPALERSNRHNRTITITGQTPQQNVVRNQIRETFPVSAAREAMGIDWMVMRELSQAIPPKYTEFIGRQLLAAINRPTK